MSQVVGQLTPNQVSNLRRAAFKQKLLQPIRTWNIVRGDRVIILDGKDQGKTGIVTEVVRKKNSLIVEGCRKTKRFYQPTESSTGYIGEVERLIHYSSVQLVDPSTGQGTRIIKKWLETGEKVRVAKKTGTLIPKPVPTARERVFHVASDTPPEEVSKQTYVKPNYLTVKQQFEAWKAADVENKEAAERIAKANTIIDFYAGRNLGSVVYNKRTMKNHIVFKVRGARAKAKRARKQLALAEKLKNKKSVRIQDRLLGSEFPVDLQAAVVRH